VQRKSGHPGRATVTNVAICLTVGGIAMGTLSGCASQSTQASEVSVGCNALPVLGKPPMPSPQRLATAVVLNFNHIRLFPPPKGITPRISATEAWAAIVHPPGADPAYGLQLGAAYQLILADWTSPNSVPTIAGTRGGERLLMWLVIGKHTSVMTHGPVGVRCLYQSAMWPVNATTGSLYGRFTYSPAVQRSR
jgi:hypothetical protein